MKSLFAYSLEKATLGLEWQAFSTQVQHLLTVSSRSVVRAMHADSRRATTRTEIHRALTAAMIALYDILIAAIAWRLPSA